MLIREAKATTINLTCTFNATNLLPHQRIRHKSISCNSKICLKVRKVRVSTAIRTLGIFNSYDKDLEQKLNCSDNIETLNDVLKLWEFRGLMLAGRILVFKSLALSKLLYACTMKVASKFVIDQLNTLYETFIWNNKRP